jgi:hypothetical protein
LYWSHKSAVIDQRHLRNSHLFDAVGSSPVPMSHSTQIADYFRIRARDRHRVNDNRIRLSIADIRMGAAGLVGLAADSCPTHRLPSDPANPEEPFSVVDSSQSDAFAVRIELRGVTGLVVPLIGGPPEIQIGSSAAKRSASRQTVAFRGSKVD